MAPHRNVLFITVDQWRGDCLSALGHPVVETPTLDALAGRGVLFANHWANAAPCGPSRACLYTGTYQHRNRSVLNGTPLDARFTNVALLARELGYDPVLFGYTDTSVDPRTVAPDDPRLFTYEGVLPGLRTVVTDPWEQGSPAWGAWLAAQGFDVPNDPHELYQPISDFPGSEDHGPTWAPARFPAELSQTRFIAGAVTDWLEANGAEPFFIHASFIRPHPPRRNPIGYHDLYDDYLGRSGLAASTMVVVTSDHGEMGGDHWLLEKLGYWDESYHVPLIVVDPRAEADGGRGSIVRAVTESVDILPTICEFIGADVPLQADGWSLAPFTNGEGIPEHWRDTAHFEWDFSDPSGQMIEGFLNIPMSHCSLAVSRGPTHKYVQFATGADVFPPLLFDLRDDPQQVHNLCNDAGDAWASAAWEGAQELLRWRMRTSERTLSGHFLSPTKGLVSSRDTWR
jgi:arylsulfatase A-like enzyme